MRLLYQFGVILTMTFIGEVLHSVIPLPIPASIYGLLLMLFCLCTKIIKLNQVKIAGDFLIDIMPPMFIPAAVGIIVAWADLKEILLPVIVITFITTVIVMVCTGKITQMIIRLKKRGENSENNSN
ncbi:CidA/LrgA family protein [Faecalimonas sp.]